MEGGGRAPLLFTCLPVVQSWNREYRDGGENVQCDGGNSASGPAGVTDLTACAAISWPKTTWLA